MASSPTTWAVDPALVTAAIKLLVWAVVVTGGALIAVLLWIWGKTDGKIDSIAKSLESLALTTSTDIAMIKTRCEERHMNHSRAGDK